MAKLSASYEYTDAELLALYREAVAEISVSGTTRKIGSREMTTSDLPEMWKLITQLEQRIAAATSGPIVRNRTAFRRPS